METMSALAIRFLHDSQTGSMVCCTHMTQRTSAWVLGAEPCDLSAMSQELSAMPAIPSLPTTLFIRRGWNPAGTL